MPHIYPYPTAAASPAIGLEKASGRGLGGACEVAAILRSRFAAEKIIAFGSLVHPGYFSDRSDIDLAVLGIQPSVFFKAWAAAARTCPFELDLVDLSDCRPALRDLIEREGRTL